MSLVSHCDLSHNSHFTDFSTTTRREMAFALFAFCALLLFFSLSPALPQNTVF